MTNPDHAKQSAYMAWVKSHSQARFNLSTSAVLGVSGQEFPLDAGALEINRPGGYGYGPLRERLARHAGVPAECVVPAEGTSMANHLAMATLLTRGDEVLIEEPTFGPLIDVAHYLGARIARFSRSAERGYAIDVAEIEAAVTPATRLIVLSNLHNPTGALVPAETLRAIGEIALRVGAHVLVDEVYLELLFDHTDAVPFAFPLGASLAEWNPFVVTSSLTKAYGLGGLRCGWVLASPEVAERVRRLDDLFAASPAHPAERLSVTAFDHLDVFRDRARALLNTNRAVLDAFLDDRRDDLDCFRPPAGTIVFPSLRRVRDAAEFFSRLREKFETSVVPGQFFEMPRHFRLGIGGDTAVLRSGLERLGAALDEFAQR